MGRQICRCDPASRNLLMKFTPTDIADVVLVAPEPVADERGHYARWYCAEAYSDHGLGMPVAQTGVSRNVRRGTLRGLHFAPESHGEAKLVRCIAGSLFDVVVDLRPSSSHFGTWVSHTLTAADHAAFHIPPGCAHGYITLEDNVDVAYQFSRPYEAGVELGVRWDDPDLAINWPMPPIVVSPRDEHLPFMRQLKHSEIE